MDKQRTIDRVVKARGIGIYSGNIVDVALFPAPDSHGIVFIRKDMPGKSVHAYSNTFIREDGCTCFENQGVEVMTVEHLMDALEELEIDNVLVELDTCEIPVYTYHPDPANPLIVVLNHTGVVTCME